MTRASWALLAILAASALRWSGRPLSALAVTPARTLNLIRRRVLGNLRLRVLPIRQHCQHSAHIAALCFAAPGCLGADAPQMVDDGTVTAVNLSEAPGDPAGDGNPEGPITALTRVETMIKLA